MPASLISLPNPAVAPMFEGDHSQLRKLLVGPGGIKVIGLLFIMVSKTFPDSDHS